MCRTHVLGEWQRFWKSRCSDSSWELKKEEWSEARFCLHHFFLVCQHHTEKLMEAKMEIPSPIHLPQSQDLTNPSYSPFFFFIFNFFALVHAYGSISSWQGRNPADKSFVHCVALINSSDTDLFPAQKVTLQGRVSDCVIIHILIQFLVCENRLQQLLGVISFCNSFSCNFFRMVFFLLPTFILSQLKSLV